MSLRSIPIRLRLLVLLAVPTLGLLGAVGVGVRARDHTAAAARAELHRSQALEALAAVQIHTSFPELATAHRRMGQVAPISPAGLAVTLFRTSVVARYQMADGARTALAGADRAAIPDTVMAAFDRQRQVFDALVAADEGRQPVEQRLIDEATAARAEADKAFGQLALSADSEAWALYGGAIVALRSAEVEFASMLPSLLGVPVATPTELAFLAGARTDATERITLLLPPELMQEADTVLGSDVLARWRQAEADAQAVAAGTGRPRSPAQLLTLLTDADQLGAAVQSIATEAVLDVRHTLATQAHRAEVERRNLVAFAAGLVALTALLSAWILRSITSPLRRLTQRAAAVAAGDLGSERVESRGRDELTRLATTIEDVVDGLRHLDRQFHALAEGRLDDASLRTPAPGAVGGYVQQRVDDLRRASGALRAEAWSDPLTGLLNRRALMERVGQIPASAPLAVLYVDLDRFKAVNDSHGHRHGDAVIRAVAARLTALVRPDDLVARVGGDEFVLVVADMAEDTVPLLVERAEAALAEPIAFESQIHSIGCSIGTSWLTPEDDLDGVLELADQAMLVVKNDHRARAAAGGWWPGR